MDCECGGHQFGSQPAIWSESVVVISLGLIPAIWIASVVVISLGLIPAIWIVSVVVISLGPSLQYGLRVWWSSVWSLPCHMDCECGGHQFGSQPCHMGCECGGHQFGSQPCHIDCECGDHQFGPCPVIWIVSVVGISLGPSLPYGLRVC